jgi:hypothetical protein
MGDISSKQVTVEERTNGSMHILNNGLRLKFREIQVRPLKEEPPVKKPRFIRVRKQPITHPWKSPSKAW